MSDIIHMPVSWERLKQDCRTLAHAIKERGIVTENTKGLVALARGGMVAGQLLGYMLDIRRVEAISVIGYDGMQAREDMTLKGNPSPDIANGADWVVVDDLVDTGRSFRFLKGILPKARYVAIYAKPQGKPEAEVTVETFPQDSWIDFPWEEDPIA